MVHAKSLSGTGFRRLSAADKIRLLVSPLGIPLELPHVLARLVNHVPDDTDGPAAFTLVRNALLHPGDDKRGTGRAAHVLFETWRLRLYYLE